MSEMQSRYIDATKIEYNYKYGNVMFFAQKEQVDEIPTADVAPVIHGHWIYKGDNHYGLNDWSHKFECSVCGREVKLHRKKDIAEFPYCHCGARMEKVEGNR